MNTPDPSFTSPGSTNPIPGPSAARQGLTRSRRRRRGQPGVPSDVEGRAALIASLARRAYPTYELFVYALICGAILGLGYLLDSQAVLLFGILVAPLLLPWIGLLLATVTGSARFFLNSFMALLLSALLVFAIGALAGLAARPFMPRTFNEAFLHSRLWWPDLIVLALGAIILAVSFIRSEAKPFLPSVMLAYGLFMPLSAGGFGLGSGLGNVWPHGLLVFLAYFAWAGMFGLLTLMALRFLPGSLLGFVMSAGLAAILVATLVILMGGGGWVPSFAMQPSGPTSTPPASPTVNANLPPILPANTTTPVVDTATPAAATSPTPVPLTLQITLPPTASPTITLTIEPTPVYARIKVGSGGGAVLRSTPGGKGITVLDNFSIVQVLSDTEDVSGTTWAHVIANVGGNRMDGWVVQLYLDVATPVPNWQPSATPAPSATP